MLLHVFGGQGKRGVLDLSHFESQYFRSVSEDLKVKSNTPQVRQIWDHFKTALGKKVQLKEKQWQTNKHINTLRHVWLCACRVTE